MSTETFARILWVVLDGFGHEHARRLLETPGRFPALERIAREGYLGSCRPPGPVCQTPPALLALFTGTEPAENGVWGYKVPDADGRLERSISGFAVERKAGTAIWEDLEASGRTFSIMNVGFRRDRVWSDPFPHLAFAYDGYRNLRVPLQRRHPARLVPHHLRGHRPRRPAQAGSRRAPPGEPAPGTAGARGGSERAADPGHAGVGAPALRRRPLPVPREPGPGAARTRGARGSRPAAGRGRVPGHVGVPPGAQAPGTRAHRRDGDGRVGAPARTGRAAAETGPRALGRPEHPRQPHDLLRAADGRVQPHVVPPLRVRPGGPPRRAALPRVRGA